MAFLVFKGFNNCMIKFQSFSILKINAVYQLVIYIICIWFRVEELFNGYRLPLTFHKQMAMCDSCSQRVFSFAHVLSLILGEDLNNDQRALLPTDVHVDLEVLAGLDRLAVEIPRDVWRRVTREEHAEDGAISIHDREIAQRHVEPRWLLLWRVGRDDSTWLAERSRSHINWTLRRGLLYTWLCLWSYGTIYHCLLSSSLLDRLYRGRLWTWKKSDQLKHQLLIKSIQYNNIHVFLDSTKH